MLMDSELTRFLQEHRIHEVECVIPDMTGIARGKILPKDLFLGGDFMRLPAREPRWPPLSRCSRCVHWAPTFCWALRR